MPAVNSTGAISPLTASTPISSAVAADSPKAGTLPAQLQSASNCNSVLTIHVDTSSRTSGDTPSPTSSDDSGYSSSLTEAHGAGHRKTDSIEENSASPSLVESGGVSQKPSMVKHGKVMVERRYEAFPGTGTVMPVRIVDEKSNFRAWELGKDFLLFTAGKPSDVLLISSHGGYAPWSSDIKVPEDSKLAFLGPHRNTLIDPGIGKTVYANSPYYATVTKDEVLPVKPSAQGASVKTLTGSHKASHIKNYSLSKFQSEKTGHETYEIIKNAMVLVRNNKVIAAENPEFAARMGFDTSFPNRDVLTVRNRVGLSSPSLQDLYTELERAGIKYKIIEHVHCRNNDFNWFPSAYSLNDDRVISRGPGLGRERNSHSDSARVSDRSNAQSALQSEAEQLQAALETPWVEHAPSQVQATAGAVVEEPILATLSGQLAEIAGLFETHQSEAAMAALCARTEGGQYRLLGALADLLVRESNVSGTSDASMINQVFLQLLHAAAEKTGANGVAEQMVTLLRSPDHDSRSLQKRPGYYQAVTSSLDVPLMNALQGALQALELHVQAGSNHAVAKSLGKMQQALAKPLRKYGNEHAVAITTPSLVQIRSQFQQARNSLLGQAQAAARAEQLNAARKQQQQAWAQQINTQLKTYGLALPVYMQSQLRAEDVGLIQGMAAEQQRQLQARLQGRSQSAELVQLEAQLQVIAAKIHEKQKALRVAHGPLKDQLKHDLKQLEQSRKQGINQRDQLNYVSPDTEAASRRAQRSQIMTSMEQQGLYIEDSMVDQREMDALFQSSQVKKLISAAIDQSPGWFGSVDQKAAVSKAVKSVTEFVMDSRYMRQKMAAINASVSRRLGTASVQPQLQAQVIASVVAPVSSEVRQGAEKMAQIQAMQQAREQAAQQASEQAGQQAREQAAQQAREQAAQQAREQAAQQAREQAAQQAREQAGQQAREQAAQQAREHALEQARQQAAQQVEERAYAEWERSFHERMAPADQILLENNLSSATENLRDIRLDELKQEAQAVFGGRLREPAQGARIAVDFIGKPRVV